MTLRFPAVLDEHQFLSEYWQKKPLLFPGGLTDLLPPLEPAELAGLACTDDTEARLIRSAGPPSNWQLKHGPFNDNDFNSLPDADWTLLVQDVDKWMPEIATLVSHFDFLPSWRIDDVMVSYAAPGGTVGPHIDEYDVFLIQGNGSRVWQTGISSGTTVVNSPVRVLEEFLVEQHWELRTGDVLYLPPGLAHHGKGVADSITFSVGFRAPSIAELILSQAASRAEQTVGRYQDSDLSRDEATDGLISAAAIQRALALLPSKPESPADAAVWFGQLVTESKPWLQAPEVDDPETLTQFADRLTGGQRLEKSQAARMAHCIEPGFGTLFVDGVAFPLTRHNRELAPTLCRGGVIQLDNHHDDCHRLLYQLYCDGKLYWPDVA